MKSIPIGHDGVTGPGSRIGACCAAGALALALLPALWPGAAAAHTCDDPFSTDLIAGRTIDAGDVKVCNDDTTLTVTYEATFPWCLLETHLHVATIPDPPADPDANIPQNKPGNPKPGQFAYGDVHDCEGTVAFEIPLDEIDGGVSPDDTVVIAAHGEVDDGEREEGAWGEGPRFVERGNWAMYFTYEVQEATCGETSKCVFVTSTRHNGNLGGLSGADATCNALASAAGLPGVYVAWLSTSSVDARDRIPDGVYVRVDGDQVAASKSELTDGSIDLPIQLTETGASITFDTAVWTGTSAAGVFFGPACQDWTSDSFIVEGRFGRANFANARWTNSVIELTPEEPDACVFTNHLYCFQQ